jgi:hypothetical protein
MIRAPFKGQSFYEWQIGPLVLQLKHRGPGRLLRIWRDPYWKTP